MNPSLTPPMWRRLRVGSLLPLVALASCGGAVDSGGAASPSVSATATAAPLQPVLASSQIVVGPNRRVSFGLLNAGGVPVPDGTVRIQILRLPPGASPQPLGPPQDAAYKGELLQGKGVYVIHQSFAQPGFYSALVQASKGSLSVQASVALNVLGTDPTPAVGSAAPKTDNPTKDQVSDITIIDTGVPPDDMHNVSVAGAIAAHHPFVVYFGSPGFCVSKTCGPELDVVKALESKYRSRGIDFVHIETYKGGRPDAQRTTSQWFDEWKLQSDPWVFVVDSHGVIAAKYDGPTTADEIEPAVQALAAPA